MQETGDTLVGYSIVMTVIPCGISSTPIANSSARMAFQALAAGREPRRHNSSSLARGQPPRTARRLPRNRNPPGLGTPASCHSPWLVETASKRNRRALRSRWRARALGIAFCGSPTPVLWLARQRGRCCPTRCGFDTTEVAHWGRTRRIGLLAHPLLHPPVCD